MCTLNRRALRRGHRYYLRHRQEDRPGFSNNGAPEPIAARDGVTAKDAAAKLCTGGGIDVCVNAKLTGRACKPALAVSARSRVIPTGQAIVPGSGSMPVKFAVARDAG